jgi:hypothetical protein
MARAPLTLFGVRHRALIALQLAMLTLARKRMAWSRVLDRIRHVRRLTLCRSAVGYPSISGKALFDGIFAATRTRLCLFAAGSGRYHLKHECQRQLGTQVRVAHHATALRVA